MIKKVLPKKIFVLLSVFLLICGCATTGMTKFKQNIKAMSDDELVSCYHGINERIKYIDNSNERVGRPDPAQNQDLIANQSYFVGGEIHGLMKREKLVVQEMRKRRINP